MDINESMTSFKETTTTDHCSNGIQQQTPNIASEELDDMDLLVYSDSDDESRNSKLSVGQIGKQMETITEGRFFWLGLSGFVITNCNKSLFQNSKQLPLRMIHP